MLSASESESLRALLHERFRKAFGPPHASEGGGANWSLAPVTPNGVHVHVILTGSREPLGVWVFDPYDQIDGVTFQQITDSAQIDEVIDGIRPRVCEMRPPSDASAPPPASSPDPGDPQRPR